MTDNSPLDEALGENRRHPVGQEAEYFASIYGFRVVFAVDNFAN